MGKGRRETAQTGTGPSPSRDLPSPNAHLAKAKPDAHLRDAYHDFLRALARDLARRDHASGQEDP